MDFLLALAELDGPTLAVLLFSVALVGLLFGVAGSWRTILLDAPGLPLWRALRCGGIPRRIAEDRAGSRAVRNAELRCMLCPRHISCEAQVGRGGRPPEDCANRSFIAALGPATPRRFPGSAGIHLT